MASSAFRFALRARPLSPCMYYNNRSFVEEYLSASASLSSLRRLSTPWFTIGFHTFRLFPPSVLPPQKKVNMTRSNMVCNSSPETMLAVTTHSAPVSEFPNHPQIHRASNIHDGTTELFPQENTFSRYHLYVSPHLLQPGSTFGASVRSEQNLKIVPNTQTTLLRNFTSTAVKDILA